MVSLLSESYNPSVRYGAAMSLGIACAGTGNKEALALLEPLADDPVAYVRQGAFIAVAMILIQQTEGKSQNQYNSKFIKYCGIRLKGLLLRRQNDKNLAIFGHFRKVRSSKRTKRGVKIVVRNKKL